MAKNRGQVKRNRTKKREKHKKRRKKKHERSYYIMKRFYEAREEEAHQMDADIKEEIRKHTMMEE